MVVGLIVITSVTEARPLYHRWLLHAIDLYAATAMDAYELGGTVRLNQYLSTIETDSHVNAVLLKENVNVSSKPIPPDLASLLERSRKDKQSHFAFGTPWRGVVLQTHRGKAYTFAAEVRPFETYGRFQEPGEGLLRLGILLLVSCTICGLLARNIIRPIQTLQKTAMDIVGGNLAARASPALKGRADEIAQLARDFDHMADRIQALLAEQKMLLRDISHELRSPLARLTVSTELVQRGDRSAAERMQYDIQLLEKMISDLLTLARIDASQGSSRRNPVHVGRLVQQIVKDAAFEGIPRSITVVQTGAFEHYVSGDSGLLHSCIENIVRNALKHSPTGGVVEVSIQEVGRPGGAAICITTMDEGKGVPSESVKQIFDPFFRVPSEGSHRQGGAGLGLSISKRVVTLYGGNIEAHNLPEGGLAVSLTFPTTGSHP
jgi:signal transduction histidine kinase